MIVRLAITLALALAAVLGVGTYRAHLIAKGDAQGAARVLALWEAQEIARSAATDRDNATKFRNAERLADEDAKAQAARVARDVAAATAVRSLRAEVARLNRRPHPYPVTDAGLAACAGEAATARELFFEGASAYQELAAAADGLSNQVAGLQGFAHDVCRAGHAGAQAQAGDSIGR